MSGSTADNEQILWSGFVSHWHYAGRWLLVVLSLAALVATFFTHLIDEAHALWLVRGILGPITLILVVWICLDRNGRKYPVTNRRVIAEFGIVPKQSNELPIQDIGHISLTVTGLWDLVGIGEVEFASAEAVEAEVIFGNIHSPEKVLALVRSL